MNEIWKFIEGFPEYQISNLGRVKSFKQDQYNGKILALLSSNLKGYLFIYLRKNNRPYRFYVHRLVLNAFIGKCPEKYEANHKDGNKENNCENNLEWITPSKNRRHAFKIGLQCHKGEKNPSSKLKIGEVWLIKKLLFYNIKQCLIAKIFKIHSATISQINCRKTWDKEALTICY